MFVMDLLNHQAMLINMIALVILNKLKSALHSDTILWFSIESYALPTSDTTLLPKEKE